jgi:hypothetical protein
MMQLDQSLTRTKPLLVLSQHRYYVRFGTVPVVHVEQFIHLSRRVYLRWIALVFATASLSQMNPFAPFTTT